MNDIVLDNIRDKILTSLGAIKPYDLLEKQHIDDTIFWIKSGEQIFRIAKPDHPEKHLVSYFVVFDEINKKYFLLITKRQSYGYHQVGMLK